MDCATSALFITERRDDHHPKDAATVTAAVFQKSGGYPYKVDHESVHRSWIREMKVRGVAIEDQKVQAVLEIYAILALGTTKYNSFQTT